MVSFWHEDLGMRMDMWSKRRDYQLEIKELKKNTYRLLEQKELALAEQVNASILGSW